MRARRRAVTVTIAVAMTSGVVGPTRASAAPRTTDAAHNVVVVLKETPAATAGTPTDSTGRAEPSQRELVSRAEADGARGVHAFATIGAVAMTATETTVNRLRVDPSVAAVVPDLRITVPTQTRDQGAITRIRARGATPGRPACSTDPARPTLEPEALQLMNVAKVDGAEQALRYADGAGVKVAVLADGVDPDNPGFIRNGRSVFSDYQDFTGEGRYSDTPGNEAFGDASSIAAQPGRVYNVADYVNQAHPRPNGCYIRVSGVSPGADLVALKVFRQDGTALTSDIVRAIEYAVDVDHVDVISESFHTDVYPDAALDPIALADAAAVRAGVAVVASTGDYGPANTIGSPASSPGVIAVGATTSYRSIAQTDDYGYPLPGVTGWGDGNISPISSAGFAQNGRVPDLVAPGDSGWALCSTDGTRFSACGSRRADAAPVGIQNFAGTSESAPFVAGVAALVMGAYAKAHPRAGKPSPAFIKRLLTSSAHDLGHPAQLQGAGGVDALAAVRAAMSAPEPSGRGPAIAAAGSNLLPDRTQLDLSGRTGATVSTRVRYRNDSAAAQEVTATTRSLTTVVARTSGTVAFDPATLPSFLNVFGAARYYTRVNVLVRKGVDRLDGSLAWAGGGTKYAYANLVDPDGRLQSYSVPQGPSDYAHVDAGHPEPGVWTMYVFARPDFTGAIAWQVTQSRFGRLGSVSPSRVRLASGRSATFTVTMPTGNPGDSAASVQLRTARGRTESLPVSIRSTVAATAGRTATFHGVFTSGNGRAPGGTATSNSFYLDVPADRPGLAVGFRLTGQTDPGEVVKAYLISPQNEPVAVQTNVVLARDGATSTTAGVQLYAVRPAPGRWHVVLEALDPVAGNLVRQPFTGYVSVADQASSVRASLPDRSSIRVSAGRAVTAEVRITNTGVVTRSYFTDARLSTATTYRLASQLPGNDLQRLPIGANPVGYWFVPTHTSRLIVAADASVPVTLETAWSNGADGGFPDLLGAGAGRHPTVDISGAPTAQGYWLARVGRLGPYRTTAPTGTVSCDATVRTAGFDPALTSSTGDLWRRALVPADPAPAFAPLTLAPGETGTVTVRVTPRRADRGRVVTGRLDIDTYDPRLGSGDVVTSLPYRYLVG